MQKFVLVLMGAMLFNIMVQAIKTDKMVNCYMVIGTPKRFQLKNIDPDLCTHISYAYFDIDNEGLKPFYQLPSNSERFNLKWANPKLKQIAVVGGDKVSTKQFSKMAVDPNLRRIFRQSVRVFLVENDFNGLDLHWLYMEKPADKENFVTLIRELREHFKYLDLELGISVIADNKYARLWYDVPNIVENVDFINVMAYNYTDNLLGHNAALFGTGEDNVNASIHFWLSQGAPASKLNMGVAFYGRHYNTMEITKDIVRYMPYYAITDRSEHLKDTVFGFDEDVGRAFLDDPRSWASYESMRGLEMKMAYVKEMGLRGVMIAKLEDDDYRGRFNRTGNYPLLQQINRQLDERFECRPGICCIKRKTVQSPCFYV
ncbi:chitotriosidase-1 [Stomoxys calcitrans]|uniref:chitotriosidase-1 n=1 Tax=Stomoxys calcitrans TaxID=35570 RepID=UPI0027E217A2|nr:chitotriosidase-1 [Stomoxys calcitrans]